MPYNDINAMRKQGNLQQALVMAEAEYARMPGRHEAVALFWCLNDDLKNSEGEEAEAIAERMRALWQTHEPQNPVLSKTVELALKSLTPEAQAERKGWKIYKTLKENPRSLQEKKELLFQYLKLNNPRPSLLHSLILNEALKIDKEAAGEFNINAFTNLWDLQNLREDDWVQRKGEEGHTPYSLVEKTISALVRQLNASDMAPTPVLLPLLCQAIEQFPKNCHLPRYHAQLLLKLGHKEEAIEKLKDLLLKMPEKFYLWDDLADLVDNLDLRLGLLCGAVMAAQNNEKYLSKIRLKLADMLCDRRMYNNALTELAHYRDLHQRNNWPLRSQYFNVYNRIPKECAPADNRMLYNQFKAKAQEFIYSDLPTVVVVKTWEKKENFNGKPSITWQLRCDQEVFWVKPHRFRLDFRLQNGALFKAKIDHGQVVWIEPTDLGNDLPWLRQATGPLQIKQPGNGKLFAFVDGVYIPGTMLGTLSDGATVTVTAIRNADDRWNALALA